MIHGAALLGADALIIPDIGCGVFENDPTVCGRICGEVLGAGEYKTRFKKIIFTGHENFYSCAMQGYASAGPSSPPAQGNFVRQGSSPDLNDQYYVTASRCVICDKDLAGVDFSSLAVLVDKS